MTNLILADPPRQTLRKGLAAYWPLATNGAVDLRSASAPQGPIDMTNNGAATATTGPTNLPSAVNMTAVGTQWLSIASGPKVLVPQGSFYFGFWAKFVTETTYYMVTKGGGGQSSYVGQYVSTLGWRFGCYADGTTLVLSGSVGSTLAGGTGWHFYEGWFDQAPAVVVAAVDLVDSTATAFAGPIFVGTAAFNLNNLGSSTLYQDVQMTALLMLNRIPTRPERQWLYNNGAGRDLVRGV